MLKLETIRLLLQDRRLVQVSRKTDVTERTIRRIRDGETNNPHNEHLESLSEYFEVQMKDAGFIQET